MPSGVVAPSRSPSESSSDSSSFGYCSSFGGGSQGETAPEEKARNGVCLPTRDKTSLPQDNVRVEDATRLREPPQNLGGGSPGVPEVVLIDFPVGGDPLCSVAVLLLADGVATGKGSNSANMFGDRMVSVHILDPNVNVEESLFYHRIVSCILNAHH
ncbi:OLC1v1007887C1 [Oldenlandia corymbosa var. corymbosa]|uniref:OLC1v1007887C1 n=1 Tax=Oldenlandia corymbosa var. corymbosa TaxID=529605 RepID=A0AAV1DNI3_OLDCO|nr:OLC1v1007887C1 [Oldenlandia corymbosa var. corymbosa]